MLKKLLIIALAGVAGLIPAFAAVPMMPGKLTPVMASFTKVGLKWTPVETATSYKVYRNGAVVATVKSCDYLDSELTADTAYTYKVSAINEDGESSCSQELSVRCLKNLTGKDAVIVQQVTDMANPKTVTADNLITSVQGSLKLLKVVNLGATSIDVGLVKAMVKREFEMAKDADAESPQDIAVQTQDNPTETVDDVMKKYFKGHSFIDLYIQQQLCDLAERHWQAGKKDAALMLYEKSLSYLPDVDPLVFNTIARMGYIKFAHINEKSTADETADAMSEYCNTMNRYFEFFPEATAENAANVHLMIAHHCYQSFPKLLAYDDYNPKVLAFALSHVEKVKELSKDLCSDQRLARFSAWKLSSMKINLCNSEGNYIKGTLTVQNFGPKESASADSKLEARTFQMGNQIITVPIYAGHAYDISVSVPVPNGKPLVYTIHAVPHNTGKRLVYRPTQATPTEQKLQSPKSIAEVALVVDRPNAPYKLKGTPTDSFFTLAWDWVKPFKSYQLKEFKVYCDGVEIGATPNKSLAGIPLKPAKTPGKYTVRAYSEDEQLSPDSQLLVMADKPPTPVQSPAMPQELVAGMPPAPPVTDTDAEIAKLTKKYAAKSSASKKKK